jgi:CcmD family protein
MTPDTFPSLFWSYTVVWVVLSVYIATIGMRVSKIERKLSKSGEQRDDATRSAV